MKEMFQELIPVLLFLIAFGVFVAVSAMTKPRMSDEEIERETNDEVNYLNRKRDEKIRKAEKK